VIFVCGRLAVRQSAEQCKAGVRSFFSRLDVDGELAAIISELPSGSDGYPDVLNPGKARIVLDKSGVGHRVRGDDPERYRYEIRLSAKRDGSGVEYGISKKHYMGEFQCVTHISRMRSVESFAEDVSKPPVLTEDQLDTELTYSIGRRLSYARGAVDSAVRERFEAWKRKRKK